jgi:tetratricopeptide (TPR) repeat protein
VPQRTTRGDLALRNLSDRISMLEKRAGKAPLDLPFREQLVDQLLTRTQLLGTFDDFGRALELGEAAVRDYPKNPKALALRARTRSAVHRFHEAAEDLEAARGLGADVDAKLAALAVARGQNLEAARDFARGRVSRSASSDRLGLLANTEAALGEFEAADEHFQAALAGLKDVSPFPVAMLTFARGVMWAEQAGDPARARPHYVEALRRLPQYVVANVHLAELEAQSGQRDLAIERLRKVVDQTADPEPAGYLGELLIERDATDATAAALITRARDGYTSLIERYRAAFLDHASEFFGGPGNDPARALAFAQENLALRPTPRAHALAIEAAVAAHDVPLTCQLVEAARPLGARSRNLAELLSAEQPQCGTR